jgi:hypothetical protein
MTPTRARTLSNSTGVTAQWNAKPPLRAESFVTKTLRSRGRRSANDDVGSSMDQSGDRRVPQNDWTYSGSHDKPPAYRERGGFAKRRNTNVFQMLAVLVVTCLVWESYRRALSTTEQFEKLKHDEGLVIMHLQKIEQTSIRLHEILGRINDGTTRQVKENDAEPVDGGPVDAELIRVQTQQLRQMEDELHHELKGLRTKLQQAARGSIVKAFGEGPIQISIDLDFGEGLESTEQISISLGYDTPYAAWSLIEQIQKDQWIGAKFSLDKGLSISAIPPDPDLEATLDFIEKSQDKHEAWTVGLHDRDHGGLSLFINLQDNTELHQHEVCIGKITEGFGSLQRLVASTRKLDGTNKIITIKSATVSRMTRGVASGFFD